MSEPKNGTRKPMNTAADMTTLTRSVAAAWVEREERASGSRMCAYERVAQTVGCSSSWLRKFIKGDEAKQPDWTVGWNLLAAYRKVCNRVEQAADNERAIARALEGQINAVVTSTLGLVDSAAPTNASAASMAARVSEDDTE